MTWYCDVSQGIPGTVPITIRSTDFPRATRRSYSSAWCWKSTKPGLSWLTVLKKRAGFQAAFDQFRVDRVAAYQEKIGPDCLPRLRSFEIDAKSMPRLTTPKSSRGCVASMDRFTLGCRPITRDPKRPGSICFGRRFLYGTGNRRGIFNEYWLLAAGPSSGVSGVCADFSLSPPSLAKDGWVDLRKGVCVYLDIFADISRVSGRGSDHFS